MGRFWAATRVVALFLSALYFAAGFSSPAYACEACERVPLAPEAAAEAPRKIGRIDVTSAVDSATSFIVEKTARGWRWLSRRGVKRTEVDITELDLTADAVADISNGSDVIASSADYLTAYDAADAQQSLRMPGFRREHKWSLTYRSDADDAIAEPAHSNRFPGLNTTLDDSVVVGLRFEWDYGWTR